MPRPRRRLGGATAKKLASLEKTRVVVGELTPAKRKALRSKMALLVKELGFDKMARDVRSGEKKASATFAFIGGMKGLSDERRRVAGVAQRAARAAGE